MTWQTVMATVTQEGFSLQVEHRDGEAWGVGTCPGGHRLAARLKALGKGNRCRPCRVEKAVAPHIATALAEGFTVQAEQRSYANRRAMYLVGCCPKGHPVAISAGNFAKGTRCGVCRLAAVHDAHLVEARRRGFSDMRIELRPRTDGTQNTAWVVGTCTVGHAFAMLTGNFSRGQQCGRCAEDVSMAATIQEGAAEGYVLLEGPRASDGARQVEGTCPTGHPVLMRAANFAKNRRRCRACASHGFKVAFPGVLYVLVAPVEGIGPVAGGPGDVVVKFGICNPESSRFANHARTGFRAAPVLAMQCPDGFVVAAVERSIVEARRAAGGVSCRDSGMLFDGCTEAFVASPGQVDVFVEAVLALIDRSGGMFEPVVVSMQRVRSVRRVLSKRAAAELVA